MTKPITFMLILESSDGAIGHAHGFQSFFEDGQLGPFVIDIAMQWSVQPGRETIRGSVTVAMPGTSYRPKIAFSGDFWRLVEAAGEADGFVRLCALDFKIAREFIGLVEKAIAMDQDQPRFFEGLVTADHTLSATILSPTDDPGAILDRAREQSDAFEINEGNETELYFGAGPDEDIREVDLLAILKRHLHRAHMSCLERMRAALPEEVAALKKAVKDLLAIADGAVDHQETIDSARSLLE